jgi:hypothetical protein
MRDSRRAGKGIGGWYVNRRMSAKNMERESTIAKNQGAQKYECEKSRSAGARKWDSKSPNLGPKKERERASR